MAVTSATPLARKLGIKEGHIVSFVNAPKTFPKVLGKLPERVKADNGLGAPLDVIVFFTESRAELTREFRYLAGRLQPDGGFWVAWPKKQSGVKTDLSEDIVREVALARGLVDNKQCAIDENWAGLRLVIKVKDR
ncbi:MAG: DUF3052 family protein [Planctomycetes bacterium]|jgi:hypothetical protein|nr:DUF3052 family protein [Planctomycetota bacterium]